MMKKYFLPLFLILGMSMTTNACSSDNEAGKAETPTLRQDRLPTLASRQHHQAETGVA